MPSTLPSIVPILLAVVMFVVMLIGMIMLLVTRFKRCPSNKILVIYGHVGHNRPLRCLHGGSAFVLPLIQDFDYLSLEPVTCDIAVTDAVSHDNVPVKMAGTLTVAIGTEPQLMQSAAVRLLKLETPEIAQLLENLAVPRFRTVLGSLTFHDMTTDHDVLIGSLQTSLVNELAGLGLILVSLRMTTLEKQAS